jgi:hypothetical protein
MKLMKATLNDIRIDLVYPCYCCQNNKNSGRPNDITNPTCYDKCKWDRGAEKKDNFYPFICLDGSEWTDPQVKGLIRSRSVRAR